MNEIPEDAPADNITAVDEASAAAPTVAPSVASGASSNLASGALPGSAASAAPLPPPNSAATPVSMSPNNEQTAQNKARIAAQEDKRQTMYHLFWLVAAFIIPVVFIYLTARDDDRAIIIFNGLRLGVTSFFVALAIIGLAQLDKKFTQTKLDGKSQFLASLLGMMLWLVWVGSGQMVFKAVDEAKSGAAFDGR